MQGEWAEREQRPWDFPAMTVLTAHCLDLAIANLQCEYSYAHSKTAVNTYTGVSHSPFSKQVSEAVKLRKGSPS